MQLIKLHIISGASSVSDARIVIRPYSSEFGVVRKFWFSFPSCSRHGQQDTLGSTESIRVAILFCWSMLCSLEAHHDDSLVLPAFSGKLEKQAVKYFRLFCVLFAIEVN